MRLLERCVGCRAGAAIVPPAQRPESSEALAGTSSIPQEVGLAHVVLDRRHPGGVVEASDVRGDERGEHTRTVALTSRFAPLCGASRFSDVFLRTRPKTPLADDRPAVNRTAPGGGGPTGTALLALASASAVERFIVSTEAMCELTLSTLPFASPTARVRRSDDARMLPSPTTVTAIAATAGARRRPIRAAEPADLDRPLEVLRRSRPQHLGEAADRRGELPAGRAIREMSAQKDALEPRQFPVEVGSRPLAGAVTGSVNRSHTRSDGGSHLKVSHSEE